MSAFCPNGHCDSKETIWSAIQHLSWKYGTVKVQVMGLNGETTWLTWVDNGLEYTIFLDSYDDERTKKTLDEL